MRPEAERGGKLAQKFAIGVFVGREERTGRVLVATPSGLVRADKFLRLPEEEQFDAEVAEAVRGVPWDAEGRRATGVDEEEEEAPRPLAVGSGDDRDDAAAPRKRCEEAKASEGEAKADEKTSSSKGKKQGKDKKAKVETDADADACRNCRSF